uniref:M28 family peptidase n=1 Tax=Chitinophaga sp. TaxID=1869181 RepID=UPI0031D0289C
MRKDLFLVSFSMLLCTVAQVNSQSKKIPAPAIQQEEIKRDLFALADDHFRGREAGTLDELKASVWLAELARKAGLEPAGDDGTYFQFYSLLRERVSDHSTVKIGNRTFSLWKDVIIWEPSFASVDAPIVFVNNPDQVDEETIKGKVVALQFTEQDLTDPRKIIPWRYVSLVVQNCVKKLAAKGAKAILFVSDDRAEQAWARAIQDRIRGTYRIDGRPSRQLLSGVPIIWVGAAALDLVRVPNQNLQANVYAETFTYPSVNVVAKVKGTDPTLANEYVLFSGHTDHDGVRNIEPGKDSILNGADDNATACAALLAIGRAFHKQP